VNVRQRKVHHDTSIIPGAPHSTRTVAFKLLCCAREVLDFHYKQKMRCILEILVMTRYESEPRRHTPSEPPVFALGVAKDSEPAIMIELEEGLSDSQPADTRTRSQSRRERERLGERSGGKRD
jgi:hypothetical protein